MTTIAQAACARVAEPLLHERIVHEEFVELEPEPGFWQHWAVCFTEGRLPPYGVIKAGRILIGFDCAAAIHLQDPEVAIGLVWVVEYGKKKIVQVCVDPALRRRGVGRVLISAYRRRVSRRVYFAGPFSEAGLLFARSMGDEVETLSGG